MSTNEPTWLPKSTYAPRMKPSRSVPAMISAALAAGVLMTTGASAAPSASATTGPPAYHQAANGRTVHLEKGHLLQISLTTASDGGYHWVVVRGKHSSKFTIVSRRVIHPTPKMVNGVPSVGGYSQTVYTIKGTSRGDATFRAIERRPWQKHMVIRRFTLHVHVRLR